MMEVGRVVQETVVLGNPAPGDFELTSYPVRSAGGVILGRALVMHDVTKERALQRLKSEFLAVASHQLRTPMTSVLAFADLLLGEEAASAEQQRRWVGLIQAQSSRMADIINDMLNASQVEAGKMELAVQDVDAQALCAALLEEFRAKSPAYTVVLRVPEEARWVRADVERMRQVLENLLDNAVKYSFPGGAITVATEVTPDGMVRFGVTDTGVGIPQDRIAGLFMPFYRVPNARSAEVTGTGLGLYIAKNLTEMQGGRMWVESAPGRGSTFFFALPGGAVPRDGAAPRLP